MAVNSPAQAGIYLVRHLKPLIPTGICYGQSDVPAEISTPAISAHLLSQLPPQARIFSSPLQRCSALANSLFPTQTIQFNPLLMELNFGGWEMCPWETIPREQLDAWAADNLHFAPPSGESFNDLCQRVREFIDEYLVQSQPIIVITHDGVIKAFNYIVGAMQLNQAIGHTVRFGSVSLLLL